MTWHLSIPSGSVGLDGESIIPKEAVGIVLFAHDSGSSRLGSRNQFVAEALRNAGIGTLLFDLLTEDEAANRDNVFDIDLLPRRVSDVTSWLRIGSRMSLKKTLGGRVAYTWSDGGTLFATWEMMQRGTLHAAGEDDRP